MMKLRLPNKIELFNAIVTLFLIGLNYLITDNLLAHKYFIFLSAIIVFRFFLPTSFIKSLYIDFSKLINVAIWFVIICFLMYTNNFLKIKQLTFTNNNCAIAFVFFYFQLMRGLYYKIFKTEPMWKHSSNYVGYYDDRILKREMTSADSIFGTIYYVLLGIIILVSYWFSFDY